MTGICWKDGSFHKGTQQLVADLNHAYKDIPALHEKDHQREGFRWLVSDDHEQSVFAFARYDNHGTPVIVISNMTPVVHHNYRVGVPASGRWIEHINTDSAAYNGSDVKNDVLYSENVHFHGFEQSISLTLPPLATLILKPELNSPSPE